MIDRLQESARRGLAAIFVALTMFGALEAHADVLSSAQVSQRTGQSIEQWAAAWWVWAFEHPETLENRTGDFGPSGNVGGPVFYVEGALDGRFRAPPNQFILVPVAVFAWIFDSECGAADCASDIVNFNLDTVENVYLTVDGVAVMDLDTHKVRAEPPIVFSFNDVANGGVSAQGVEAGYWVMLEPLSAGVHTLSFGWTFPFEDEEGIPQTFDFTALVTLAVPEPDVLPLLGSGLLLLGLMRRRRFVG